MHDNDIAIITTNSTSIGSNDDKHNSSSIGNCDCDK